MEKLNQNKQRVEKQNQEKQRLDQHRSEDRHHDWSHDAYRDVAGAVLIILLMSLHHLGGMKNAMIMTTMKTMIL